MAASSIAATPTNAMNTRLRTRCLETRTRANPADIRLALPMTYETISRKQMIPLRPGPGPPRQRYKSITWHP